MKNPAFSPITEPDRANLATALQRWASRIARDGYDACPHGPATRAFALVLTLILAMLINLVAPFESARAQGAGILANGDLAVSGFSGTKDVGGQTFIDTDGVSLKVFDVSGKGSPDARVVDAPVKFEAFARDIGQVFGVALDNAPNPNIYATSTTAHGLKIVIPDNNGDGVPERVNTGQPGAMFMDGQFGTALGGGPGTVWRIDGTTGEITKFADISFGGIANSGAGLGNIAFDPAHYQFYVSDMDTGAVHRLDLSGNDIGIFDHGVDGRQAAGLPAVPMNMGDKMDITSLAFDSTNSATWGLADSKRRVWGLAYYNARLYYSVLQGSQVWSVGINADGSFGSDARIEINAVPGGKAVSDILFTSSGRMILAQRGGHLSAPDYTRYHEPGQNRVLRYARDLDGNWIQEPDEYAIGFPVDHKNAAGGVALSCDGTLWSTGDALRNDPALSASLLPGGPLAVHGLQGNDVNHVRPLNVPPWASWFVDYDNYFDDPEKAGHVGDVEVYRDCKGGFSESFPGWYPIPDWYPHDDWTPPGWWPRNPDLDIDKYANECKYVIGLINTIECTYTIVVTNVGAADFVGHLHVDDNPPATALYIPPPGGSIPWNCAQPGGAGTQISCTSANVENLHPGESETLEITIQVTPGATDEYIENCATVDDPFDFWPNEDCDWSELPRPDLEIEKTFFNCVPEGALQRCFFIITVENVGGAPYTGPLQVSENVPAGTIFGAIHLSTSPGWGCVGGAPIVCTLPDPPGVTMNPGDVEAILISVLVPFNGGQTDYENCVDLGSEHADDPVAPGVNHSCAPFTVTWFVPKCPAGWTEVPEGGAPPGMLVIAIDGIHPDGTKWGLMCMQPKPEEEAAGPKPQPDPPLKQPEGPACRPGETLYPSARQVPQSWTSRKVTLGNKSIWCAKPGRVTIPRPECRKDEKQFSNASRIPNGWTRRSVTAGNTTIWCAKPGLTTTPDPVGPTCSSGEKQVTSPRTAPKGWTVRTVTAGKRTIYCAKPGTLTPVKPRCEGGKLVLLKSLPPKWRCICPARTTLKGGKCVSSGITNPQSTPQTTVPPTLTCPKGWSKIRGKCIPPKPPVKPCPRGWKRIKGKCTPPKLQVTPQIKKPLILKPQTRPQIKKPLILKPQSKKPTIRTLPKTTAKPKQSTGKVMLMAPSTNLKRKLR